MTRYINQVQIEAMNIKLKSSYHTRLPNIKTLTPQISLRAP